MQKAKAIVLLTISGALLVLWVVLMLLNLDNRCTVHVFIRSVTDVRVSTIIFYAAITGGVLWVIWRFSVPRGIRLLKQARRADEERRRQEHLDRLVAEDDARATPAEEDKPHDDREGQ